MNKIYKLVWNTRAHGYVVASEAASSRGRAPGEVRTIAALAASVASVLASGSAWASCGNIDVNANTSATVIADCTGQNVDVSATIHVPGDKGLTNVYNDAGTDLGSITIASTGVIMGQEAVLLSSGTLSGTLLGDFTNNGFIESYWSGSGSGAGGPGVTMRGLTISGTFSNTGTITGGHGGIQAEYIDGQLLKNSGTITSTGYGVSIADSSFTEIRNEAGALIHGNNLGLWITNNSSVALVDNAGTISSGNDAIRVYDDTFVNKIVNREGGAITSESSSGIYVEAYGVLGDLENAGLIQGSVSGLLVEYATVTGTIDNKTTGVIQGAEDGIRLKLESQVNAIINEGTISGGNIGIDGYEGAVITGGIVNSGTISGGDYAIFINTGHLSTLDRIDLVGPQAKLIGDVSAPTTDVNVKSGASFTTTNAFNVRSFTVETGATLTLTDAEHTTNGLSLNGIQVSQGFLNKGSVVIGAGTLGRVTGDYTQTAGSTLTIGVDSIASHGVLSVSGNAALANGSTLNVNVGGNASFTGGEVVAGVVQAGDTLTVNTANGLVVRDNSVLYKFTASNGRTANELDLIVERDQSPFVNNVGTGRTPLGGVALNLDQILANGVPAFLQPVLTRLSNLPANELPAAMAQLVPVMTGAGSQAGVSALRSMNKIIQSRVESNQGLSSGNPASERYMWVRAFGSSGDQNSQDVVAGFRSQTSGIVLGGDQPINDKLRAGFAFTYARTDIDSRGSGAPSSLDVSTYELVHYGSYNLDPVTDINYQLDMGYNDVKGKRQIVFMGQQAHSDFSSLNLHASVGIGRTWAVAARTSLTPSVRADYTHMRTGSYTETGADALNLQVDSSTFKELMLTADVKASHNLTERTKLVGNISAGYDFLDKQSVTTSAFVGGGTVFETKGLDSSPWLYRTGLGLLHDNDNMEYSLRYDLERRTSGYTNQTLSARVRWAF